MNQPPETGDASESREASLRVSILDRFIPVGPNLTDPDWLSRARLLIGASWVIGMASLVGAVWVLAKGPIVNLPIVLLMLIGSLTIPWGFSRTGSLSLGAHGLNAVVGSGLIGLIINTGGETLPPYVLLPCLPLLASLIADLRTGIIWAVLGYGVLAIAYLTAENLLFFAKGAPLLSAESIAQGKFFGSALMLAIVTSLCVSEGRLRRESVGALRRSRSLSEERYQQVLAQQRKMAKMSAQEAKTRDRFFSHVSHELRTPLTPLHQFLTLLLDEIAGPIGPEQREFLEVALRSADQLKKSIGDLTEAAHLQSGDLRMQMAVVDLLDVVRRSSVPFEKIAAEKRVELAFSGDPSLEALCDGVRVVRVMRSLLENSIRFAPPGSVIDIIVAPDPESAGMLRVSVHDRGPGIAPELRERIFMSLGQGETDEWESRHGLGLGLYIARALVDRQGGRIWVASENDSGTTFSFTLAAYDFVSLVRPSLFVDGRLQDTVGLLTASLRPRGEPLEQHTADRLRQSLRNELRVVLYPKVDVLLPTGTPGLRQGQNIALTRTNAQQLDALRERVLAHFEAESFLEKEDCTVELSVRIVSLSLTDRSGDADPVAQACAQIEREIRSLS